MLKNYKMLNFKLATGLFIIFLFKQNLFAQDTIKVMHYNLMYYGKNFSDCTSATNNIDEKNRNLKTIIQYVKPDIFSVNEMDGEGAYPVTDDASYLLDNALNVDGITHYRKIKFQKIYLANTIFYNVNKLVLKNNFPISFYVDGNPKIFNVYKFYFNAEDLITSNDTAYIYCVVAHLKAGSGSTDEQQRAFETSLIMDYFESLGEKGNYIIMGDFNVYSPTEPCFQNLINPDNSLYTFYDPANQIGEWSSNYMYRKIHTQSTHSFGDCFAAGGMDDRFDFILASEYIMNGTNHYEFITDSYKVVGQDGSSYNNSLNITTNSVVPNNVATALYNMSDHLPVYLELKVDQNRGESLGINEQDTEWGNVFYNNPAKGSLDLKINFDQEKEIGIQIYSVKGDKIYDKKRLNNYGSVEEKIPVSEFSNGIYILKITNQKEIVYTSKVIIQN